VKIHEKRLVPREPISNVPKESIQLVVNGKNLGVEKLRDISGQGISLELDRELPVSQSVSLRYSDKHANVEVHGRVAWCKPNAGTEAALTPPSTFILGLELMSPMMLLAVLPRAPKAT
jgi:hypothetical protein